MKEANMAHNNGVLRSDLEGSLMKPSKKSMKEVTPSSSEVQVDHILSVDKGGLRTNTNLQLLTRKQNRDKSNN